jgi:hypothetical protein
MLLEDHIRRVARLLRGERKVEDLQRLFSDLRLLKPGRASVQEIGHFAAHRLERDSGISLARANDIQTSAKLWQLQFDGTEPDMEHLQQAGYANLRIMPEERIKEQLGISRQTAEQSFRKALKKYGSGGSLKYRERQVLKVFGLSMMWQFAFSDTTLRRDFLDLLVQEGSLSEEDRASFEPVLTFVSLYALSIMHGTRLKMADGSLAQLRLAASSEAGLLRIKAEIPVCDTPKPITTSVPMFETELLASAHCDPKLLTRIEEPIPAEIDGERLVALPQAGV